ncbi:glycosyltransferase [Parafilimonas terrae]|uniref:Glycosyl transferase family 2 n=1 Tax=Parafilimonas terrae TaxID=1465490 RepID=A0A1I5WG26_9BACT|nr:glycosyltransferase [Parafilimonas terrae]SFQ18724.1 Glycosyl transferase family 2 [Parafilimonas terrae]
MVKVSVIIPNYNHERFLQQRIESILNQTYKDFEMILLDDCSTDSSIDILNQYKEHQQVSHIIVNEKNSGSTFKQWQKGVALAVGEYVWIAESDDYAAECFLETAVKNLENNRQVGLFFSDYHVINESGILITPKFTCRQSMSECFANQPVMDGRTFAEEYLFIDNWLVNASAVVFRKSFFLSAGTSYTAYKIAGDWRMWIDICLQADVIFCNKKIDFFRSHTNTVRYKTTSILTKEAILLYKYILTKTSNQHTKAFLKNRMCDLWFKNLEVDTQVRQNFKLMVSIFAADLFFFMRVGRRLIKNAYLSLKY